ncbi:hypothetical protein P153DRAFT_370091 [Dothidotthia symphoricarpi CBS 119687]|uniref:Uncharacterized protein n=1 Tax=Dothidotthia symphoricarpi CBS 119687 TaxID=1392245 RepID=A0A6A6A3E2_9PLEO|nr:uncharacterized protein P153DRAFT_370091 [Dothidotthia symphoricarpi CBS 119687]KAF2125427.1 hypothetical protein P153DRAFT_370091 [Dothidotthia symphoricarpi CBS 119687]
MNTDAFLLLPARPVHPRDTQLLNTNITAPSITTATSPWKIPATYTPHPPRPTNKLIAPQHTKSRMQRRSRRKHDSMQVTSPPGRLGPPMQKRILSPYRYAGNTRHR